ncbi:arsenite methyltransferase-like [Haliotis rubra]|uniref:arsenite methyltransferase-like n=1 Tax=Haliotis rubra TaxID=36100 RepID=UPI001EE5D7FA|nr:arsenite methyltransferase-like [Haliotis rubra]XP_046553209.1 arsenite methyltransferase-like [Haliotis rubra]
MAEINAYIKDFYNSTAIKCDFICKVNDWDLTPDIKEIVAELHPETMRRYYGSGLIIPEGIEGKRILDIGCGSGSLVFILSKLVGPTGSVVGMDLTPNLITEGKNREDYHRDKWGYDKKNTEFFEGNAENISNLEDESFDIVVSNGVFCLVPNKANAFAEAFRLLKPDGEFYLNDVYGEKPAPPEMNSDLKAWDLGLTGSQLPGEFLASAKKAGFTTPYLTCVGPVNVSEAYKAKLPGRRYICAGSRMYRLAGGSNRGPASVTYKGNIKGHESELRWDVSMTFKSGKTVTVDGELATVLARTRYSAFFDLADAPGPVNTQRGQNPFTYLDRLETGGKSLPHIYTVE